MSASLAPPNGSSSFGGSVFEALVNAAACQQLCLDVGIHLLDRLADVYGPEVALRGASGGFPGPDRLRAAEPAELRRLGFSRATARTIVEIARRAASGALDLDALAHTDPVNLTSAPATTSAAPSTCRPLRATTRSPPW